MISKAQRKYYLKEFLGYDFNQQTMIHAEQQLTDQWYNSNQQDHYNLDFLTKFQLLF